MNIKRIFFGFLSANLSTQRVIWPISKQFWKASLGAMGNNVRIMRGTKAVSPNNIRLGENVYIGERCALYGYANITIGQNALIAREVIILTRNHIFSSLDSPIRDQGYSVSPVTIEEDVWVGARVTILPGVTIGKGSVVAAGSVVTKDIPEYAIVAGIPARQVKSRLEQ